MVSMVQVAWNLCYGSIYIGMAIYYCWRYGGNGWEDLVDPISQASWTQEFLKFVQLELFHWKFLRKITWGDIAWFVDKIQYLKYNYLQYKTGLHVWQLIKYIKIFDIHSLKIEKRYIAIHWHQRISICILWHTADRIKDFFKMQQPTGFYMTILSVHFADLKCGYHSLIKYR